MIPVLCGAATLMGMDANAFQDDTNGCYAVEVLDSNQGLKFNGDPVPADRSVLDAALNAPDASNAAGGFYSLGLGGDITLQLGGAVLNQPGSDLMIFETSFTGDDCGLGDDETALVEVSQFGVTWFSLGEICRDAELDIDGIPFSFITQVRITDTSTNNGDGWDLDGIMAVGGCIDMDDPDFCFGSRIVDFQQGLTKNGDAVPGNRSDENEALGQPEMVYTAGVENFVSLGYGGSIIIGFDGVVLNEPGDDILVQEITGMGAGATAPWVETAEVFVSADNVLYYSVGTLNKFEAGTFDIDAAGVDLPLIRYVKVEDVTPMSSISGDAFDLDGIIALNGCSEDPFQEPEVCFNFDYFVANQASGSSTIELYAAKTVGGNSVLSLITSRDLEISIAYDEEENVLYGINAAGTQIEKIDPINGNVLNTIPVDAGFGGQVFSAVYKNGILYSSSGAQNRVVAIDITDGSFVEVVSGLPINGGDLAFIGDDLYINYERR